MQKWLLTIILHFFRHIFILFSVFPYYAAPSHLPVMARLISSTGGFLPENSPIISPSKQTTMRSDISRISSKSALISKMPTPRARAPIICSWTKLVAPISRPLVGCAMTSSAGSFSSSRARMTFCWLPPESERTLCETDVQRTSYFSASVWRSR